MHGSSSLRRARQLLPAVRTSVFFAGDAPYKLMQPSGYFSLDRHGSAELRGTSSGSDVRSSPPGVGPGSSDPTHD
ncbi:MAG: hypothetical protein ACK56F_21430 [bacterium]